MTCRPIAPFEYKAPTRLEDALSILDAHGPACKILAGGTDLVVNMKQGSSQPSVVMDIKRIPELGGLEMTEKGELHIGAAVTISRLLACDWLPEALNILVQACARIGSVQIRNRGTLAGNICNAAPSADSAPALLCLGAKAVAMSRDKVRTIDLEQFFMGPGKTALAANELLTKIVIPNPHPRSAGCSLCQTTRGEMDIAIAGVASYLSLAPEGRIRSACIALGAVGPTPLRARQAEDILLDTVPSTERIREAAEKAAADADPISDLRGSTEYRQEMVKVLTRRTLQRVCQDLGVAM